MDSKGPGRREMCPCFEWSQNKVQIFAQALESVHSERFPVCSEFGIGLGVCASQSSEALQAFLGNNVRRLIQPCFFFSFFFLMQHRDVRQANRRRMFDDLLMAWQQMEIEFPEVVSGDPVLTQRSRASRQRVRPAAVQLTSRLQGQHEAGCTQADCVATSFS